jgi:predicted phosphohydrolase
MKITLLSDTHSKHKQLTSRLMDGGDILLCAGDISSMGYDHEIRNFLDWYKKLPYDYKILVAGNHDWGFQFNYGAGMMSNYPTIRYLQDNSFTVGDILIYGSPWVPEFMNWAFNLPRNGEELKRRRDMIPPCDILVTHCPPFGILDTVPGDWQHLGDELLRERVNQIKPKIHVFGDIHGGYGYVFNGDTHFINAAVLNEQYIYCQKPIVIEWDKETNEIEFL